MDSLVISAGLKHRVDALLLFVHDGYISVHEGDETAEVIESDLLAAGQFVKCFVELRGAHLRNRLVRTGWNGAWLSLDMSAKVPVADVRVKLTYSRAAGS